MTFNFRLSTHGNIYNRESASYLFLDFIFIYRNVLRHYDMYIYSPDLIKDKFGNVISIHPYYWNRIV